MTTDSPGGSWDPVVVPWHLDEQLPGFPVPAGAPAPVSPPLPPGTRTGRMTALYRAVAGTVARSPRPLLLTGDCTTALGMAAGLQRRHPDLAVVWLDAHGDFNTPATTITGYLGGMPLAMLTGRAPDLISGPLGLRPVSERNVVLVDARDLDPAEQEALAASQVRRVPASPAALGDALAGLGAGAVYLHVDADIVDSAELPGLRVPAGGGPSLGQVEGCLAAITAAADVAAACIACTWLPGHLGDERTRTAIARLGGAFGAPLSWPDRAGGAA
ncbi:MAG: arginase family protein [Actinobacteria bacterium]|nr:arginase family protein [Actinomycetota bacterium]MBO0787976.1 arginase family protein [Actinomycetota bacterium]